MSNPTSTPHEESEPDEDGDPITITLGREELVVRRRFEVYSILNDLMIAIWFAVGSVFFFFEALYDLGIWLFVVGSVQLGIRPALRLSRRVQLQRITRGTPNEVARDF
ncbi:YrhK family protein [Pseudonocardia sp. KRD291]|uniref:YrhK family protein n=1 Tax=Pseudonocardia sp. KRD291 TaxID=2792007 RepID=UPI001C4A1D0C|nr:YrhK family protein [Pseudonocardia sp. KRD291]MBW0104378.1 YrhK family protein [Pseudonocardia sp. KRD291]